MRIALGIEYDGSPYCGWQRQDEEPSVQASVERALSQVADQSIKVICAGRTDTGVHATAQVIHLDTDVTREMRAWVFGGNANLPKSISVQWALAVSDEFHARFSAQRRRYRYVIYNRPIRPAILASRVSWEFRPLDATRMRAAAQHLVGEHDFSSYRAIACQAKSPVRTLYRLDVTQYNELIILDLEANAFLHHMVRNIAGVLMNIGRGEREPDWAREVLEHRDRTKGGVTAPAGGLYLTGVEYPEHFGLPTLSPSSVVW